MQVTLGHPCGKSRLSFKSSRRRSIHAASASNICYTNFCFCFAMRLGVWIGPDCPSFCRKASAQTGPLKVPDGFKQARPQGCYLRQTANTSSFRSRWSQCSMANVKKDQVEKGKPMYYNDKRQASAFVIVVNCSSIKDLTHASCCTVKRGLLEWGRWKNVCLRCSHGEVLTAAVSAVCNADHVRVRLRVTQSLAEHVATAS